MLLPQATSYSSIALRWATAQRGARLLSVLALLLRASDAAGTRTRAGSTRRGTDNHLLLGKGVHAVQLEFASFVRPSLFGPLSACHAAPSDEAIDFQSQRANGTSAHAWAAPKDAVPSEARLMLSPLVLFAVLVVGTAWAPGNGAAAAWPPPAALALRRGARQRMEDAAVIFDASVCGAIVEHHAAFLSNVSIRVLAIFDGHGVRDSS